jgi:SAM-dependent methyltransferase
MLVVDTCVICGSADLERTPSLVSPFLHRYVFDPDAVSTDAVGEIDLCRCTRCDFSFFDHRYDSEEVQALYREYRSDGYFRERRRVEPLYTRKINEAMRSDAEVIALRRETVGRFIMDTIGRRAVASILDFGGDAGQFIPNLESADRFVFEISDVEPVPGVTRVGSLDDLPQEIDLVMLMHVLEHASQPKDMLDEIKELVAPDGCVYVEVPLDRPRTPPMWAARLHARWIRSIGRTMRRTVVADAFSTPLRVLFRNRWIPGTFPRLHEHINFFSEESLRALFEAAGWEPIAPLRYRHGDGILAVRALGYLARVRP